MEKAQNGLPTCRQNDFNCEKVKILENPGGTQSNA